MSDRIPSPPPTINTHVKTTVTHIHTLHLSTAQLYQLFIATLREPEHPPSDDRTPSYPYIAGWFDSDLYDTFLSWHTNGVTPAQVYANPTKYDQEI